MQLSILQEENMKLNKQIQVILEEDRAHKTTVEELEVEVQDLKARMEYMEAITRKYGKASY
jgi:uncharacterized protein (DUF3084 family)